MKLSPLADAESGTLQLTKLFRLFWYPAVLFCVYWACLLCGNMLSDSGITDRFSAQLAAIPKKERVVHQEINGRRVPTKRPATSDGVLTGYWCSGWDAAADPVRPVRLDFSKGFHVRPPPRCSVEDSQQLAVMLCGASWKAQVRR